MDNPSLPALILPLGARKGETFTFSQDTNGETFTYDLTFRGIMGSLETRAGMLPVALFSYQPHGDQATHHILLIARYGAVSMSWRYRWNSWEDEIQWFINYYVRLGRYVEGEADPWEDDMPRLYPIATSANPNSTEAFRDEWLERVRELGN